MKTVTCMLAGAALIALAGTAHADDHLFQAQQHGLASGSNGGTNSHAFVANPAGRSGDLAPGQWRLRSLLDSTAAGPMAIDRTGRLTAYTVGAVLAPLEGYLFELRRAAP